MTAVFSLYHVVVNDIYRISLVISRHRVLCPALYFSISYCYIIYILYYFRTSNIFKTWEWWYKQMRCEPITSEIFVFCIIWWIHIIVLKIKHPYPLVNILALQLRIVVAGNDPITNEIFQNLFERQKLHPGRNNIHKYFFSVDYSRVRISFLSTLDLHIACFEGIEGIIEDELFIFSPFQDLVNSRYFHFFYFNVWKSITNFH